MTNFNKMTFNQSIMHSMKEGETVQVQLVKPREMFCSKLIDGEYDERWISVLAGSMVAIDMNEGGWVTIWWWDSNDKCKYQYVTTAHELLHHMDEFIK